MKLKIDTIPKLYKLSFFTLLYDYAQTSSPRSIIRQSGLEFDHFRPYQPGDDAKLIDWIASARTDETLVRVYEENTSLNILILLDVSESMVYGTKDKMKLEYGIELVINMAFGILNYGDSVGVVTYNNDVVSSVPFESGVGHTGLIREVLQRPHNYGGGLNFEYILSFVHEQYKSTHLIIIISDFLGYGESLYQGIHTLADQYDILGIMLYDQTDVELDPKSPIVQAQDPYSNDLQVFSPKDIAKKYHVANLQRIDKLREFFEVMGRELWTVSTEDAIETKIPRLLANRNNTVE